MISKLSNAKTIYRRGAQHGAKPDPDLKVWEWADKYRTLPQVSCSEPGQWRTARVPFMYEVMACLSPSHPCKRVCLMKGSQISGTEVGNNWVGFNIGHAPGPMLMVLPTLEMAKRSSLQRISPMIKACPTLNEKIAPARERDSNNTTLAKSFPGGLLVMSGANSPASARSMSVRYLFLDEVDEYRTVCPQGDFVALLEKRCQTYARRKIFFCSTPLLKGFSRIETEFLGSDQRYYNIHCPECGFLQVLKWEGIKFERDKEYKLVGDAAYLCMECGCLIPESKKTGMFADGKWISTNAKGAYPGFHLSSLYSPIGWFSWNELVQDFLDFRKDRSVEKQQTWTNTALGETWETQGNVLDPSNLHLRREGYDTILPKGCCVITAAADIQGDRIEVELKGWGRGRESWGLAYKIIKIKPTKREAWKELDEFLLRQFTHESGAIIGVSGACIDSGYLPHEVYSFTKPREARHIYATKGSSIMGSPFVSRPKTNNSLDAKLFHIGTETGKSTLFSNLQLEDYGPGFCHFNQSYDIEYFKQLTAEKQVTIFVKGQSYLGFKKIHGRANEAIDINVLCSAALSILNVDIDSIADRIQGINVAKTQVKSHRRGRRLSQGVQV
jgi:phage terminase large subunit GpA-like protein